MFDLPLYATNQSSNLSDLRQTAYLSFTKAIVLARVMCQTGEHPQQVAFRDILLRLRNAKVTQNDWEYLMTRTSNVSNLQDFNNAIHLYPTIETVAEHNLMKLHRNNQPVAVIKAVHSRHNAVKGSSDDAGGLEPLLHLAHNARVMLISN